MKKTQEIRMGFKLTSRFGDQKSQSFMGRTHLDTVRTEPTHCSKLKSPWGPEKVWIPLFIMCIVVVPQGSQVGVVAHCGPLCLILLV